LLLFQKEKETLFVKAVYPSEALRLFSVIGYLFSIMKFFSKHQIKELFLNIPLLNYSMATRWTLLVQYERDITAAPTGVSYPTD
jgi:hypothetical protein